MPDSKATKGKSDDTTSSKSSKIESRETKNNGEKLSWLERGEKSLEKGDVKDAIKCAECGLEELGDDYIDPGTEDDTGLKLFAARDLIERGRNEDGARLMLRMLRERQNLQKARASKEGPQKQRNRSSDESRGDKNG